VAGYNNLQLEYFHKVEKPMYFNIPNRTADGQIFQSDAAPTFFAKALEIVLDNLAVE